MPCKLNKCMFLMMKERCKSHPSRLVSRDLVGGRGGKNLEPGDAERWECDSPVIHDGDVGRWCLPGGGPV